MAAKLAHPKNDHFSTCFSRVARRVYVAQPRVFQVFCSPSQAGSADVRPEAVGPAVWPAAAVKGRENRQKSLFLRIFGGLVRLGRSADRLGTHIPGFSGPLRFIAILHNFFPPITLAGTAVQSGLGQNRQKTVKKHRFCCTFCGRPRPNQLADRPDRDISETGWQCRFWGCKKIAPL